MVCVRACVRARVRAHMWGVQGDKLLMHNQNIIEQVNLFNYLGNMLSYEKEFDIDNKLHNYLKITDILNNVFRPQKTLK